VKFIRSLILVAAAPALIVAQIPIKSLPFEIEKSGSYALVRNLASDGTGITVAASHVSIDLGGFMLQGQRNSANGIYVRGSQTDLAVFNGSITGWGVAGVSADNAMNVDMHDLRVSGNGECGLRVGPAAIVSDVVSQANGGSGIVASEGLVASGIDSTGNGLWGIEAGTGSVLTDNSVVGNLGGGILFAGNGRVAGNSVIGNGHLATEAPADCSAATLAGIAVMGGGALIDKNVVIGNGLGLQLLQAGNRVSGNVVKANRFNYEFVQGNQLELLVSELPLRIEWPAVVMLAGTLVTTEGDGLIVAADGVTIDLGGHVLLARDGTGNGILVDGARMGLVVKNGTIQGWEAAGIDARDTMGSMFQDLLLHENGEWGLRCGDGNKVVNVVAHKNVKDGILVGMDTLVQDCTATANGNDGIHLGDHAMAVQCVASENVLFGVRAFKGSTVRECTASHNSMGIAVDEGATVKDCTTSYNSLIGIRADKSSIIEGNTVQHSDDGIVIMDGPGSRVAHNNLTGNFRGLWIVGTGNIAYCNSASNNGTNYQFADGNAVSQIYDVTGNPAFWVSDAWGNLSY
jgi:parallel beta-helix repeat protein